jgi:uncharacterized protein YggE
MQKVTLNVDLRIVCAILLLVIAGMLAVWRPWQGSTTQRKLTITGQAEIDAVPDEFVFSPYFERKDADAAKAKQAIDALGAELAAELEKLGVAPDDIKLDSSSYNYDYAYPSKGGDEQTVTLSVTVTVSTKDLAQKVQDYLAGTDAKGQLTATANFSEQKRKELEAQVRERAVADAKQKADSLARQLDAKLGKVLEVTDAASFQPPWIYLEGRSAVADDAEVASLPVKPGKQTVTLTVSVTFGLR